MEYNMNGEVDPEFADAQYARFYKSLWKHRNRWYDFLHQFLGGHNKFIRETAFPFRKLCLDIYQAHKQMLYMGFERRFHCYVSVASYGEYIQHQEGQRPHPIYNTYKPLEYIFFDIDLGKWWHTQAERELLERDDQIEQVALAQEMIPMGPKGVMDALEHARMEAMKVKDFFGGRPNVWFSGSKGFHVDVHLKKPVDAPTQRKYAQRIRDELELRMCDPSVWGDYARVRRIPYTVHPTTCLFMVPVEKDDTLQEILDRAAGEVIPGPMRRRKVDVDRYLEKPANR